MKKKKPKLVCDLLAEDNTIWFDRLKTVVGQEELVEAAVSEITEKAIKQGIRYEELDETISNSLDNMDNLAQFTKIMCLNNWYQSGRQVYKFDDTLSELLQEQAKEDLRIDSSILNQLPIPHFYIIRKSKRDGSSEGFFFSYIESIIYIFDTSKDNKNALYCTFVESGKTISEGYLSGMEKFSTPEVIGSLKGKLKEFVSDISEYMQFVVYLSAINSEIVPVTKGAVVKRQAVKRDYKPKEKTEFSEVGYRVGSAIRKSISAESREKVVYIGEHGKGSPKTPHIRRSHFHSYWTGSGNDKKIEVKWINTIFVNGAEKPDKTTVHNVK